MKRYRVREFCYEIFCFDKYNSFKKFFSLSLVLNIQEQIVFYNFSTCIFFFVNFIHGYKI